ARFVRLPTHLFGEADSEGIGPKLIEFASCTRSERRTEWVKFWPAPTRKVAWGRQPRWSISPPTSLSQENAFSSSTWTLRAMPPAEIGRASCRERVSGAV